MVHKQKEKMIMFYRRIMLYKLLDSRHRESNLAY
jgi:hypothetical protein